MARLLAHSLRGGTMQIQLNDKDRELLQEVDTSKMGWINDVKLKNNPKFQAVAQYDDKEIMGYG